MVGILIGISKIWISRTFWQASADPKKCGKFKSYSTFLCFKATVNTFGFVMGFWDYKKFNRIYKRISPTFYMFQMIYTILYKTCSSSNSFDENRVLMHFQEIDFLLVSLHEMFSCHFPWKYHFWKKKNG